MKAENYFWNKVRLSYRTEIPQFTRSTNRNQNIFNINSWLFWLINLISIQANSRNQKFHTHTHTQHVTTKSKIKRGKKTQAGDHHIYVYTFYTNTINGNTSVVLTLSYVLTSYPRSTVLRLAAWSCKRNMKWWKR